MKRPAPNGIAENNAEQRETALGAYAQILGIAGPMTPAVTSRVSVELRDELERAADAVRSGRPLDGSERERLASAIEAARELVPGAAEAERKTAG